MEIIFLQLLKFLYDCEFLFQIEDVCASSIQTCESFHESRGEKGQLCEVRHFSTFCMFSFLVYLD